MRWSDPYILKIHKPVNVTSFDIVRKLKKILPKEVKKIGYYGTLDPFADGLLLVALNQANRLTPMVHQDLSKTYVATGVLGVETATQDLTSEITQKDETPYFQQVISQFEPSFYQDQWKTLLGKYLQAPPVYSAAKFQGKKLCEWARQDGIEIKKEEVERNIYRLEIEKLTFPEITFSVEGSSGTYIRTLFVDMAKKVGTLGVLSKLRRTKIGSIENREDLPLEQLMDHWQSHVVDPRELLSYQTVELNEKQAADFSHGRTWTIDQDFQGNYWATFQNKILGLAHKDVSNTSKVLVGFT